MKGNSLGHNTKAYYHSDYCPIEKCDYSIVVAYHKFPVPQNGKYHYHITRNYNCLVRHEDNQCTLQYDECPVYKSAPRELNEDAFK